MSNLPIDALGAAPAARLASAPARCWWLCTDCRAVLGELAGGIVTVRIRGREIEFPFNPEARQTCGKCGRDNVLGDSGIVPN